MHGPCVISRILGSLVGVVNFANIIMVIPMCWVTSVIDAVSKIILDIEHRTGHLMKGRVVISISLGSEGDFCENEGQLKGASSLALVRAKLAKTAKSNLTPPSSPRNYQLL